MIDMSSACSRALLIGFILLSPAGSRAQTILNVNLANRATGTYTRTMAFEDFHPFSSRSYTAGLADGRVQVVAGAAGESKSLQVKYPKGKIKAAEGGAQFIAGFSGRDELVCTYYLKFRSDFAFARGGKLPGLCGGECNSGGEKPSGSDGWSARYMFREGGRAVVYLYHPDQPTNYGQDFQLVKDNTSLKFVPGRWYKMTQRVKLNTPGRRDGVLQVWVDDRQALSRTDIRYRSTTSLKIDGFFFCTFFGGDDPSWAPSKDEYSYFRDFLVTSGQPVASVSGSGVQLQPATAVSSKPLTRGHLTILSGRIAPERPRHLLRQPSLPQASGRAR